MNRRRLFPVDYGHRELEYVSTTGFQYATLDHTPSYDDDIEVKFFIDNEGKHQSMGISGFMIDLPSEEGIIRTISSADEANTVEFDGILPYGDIVVKFSKDTFQVNDITKGRISDDGKANTSMNILSLKDDDSSVSNGFIGKFYYYKHWDKDGNAIFDIIPVIQLKTGKICLYDKIKKKYIYTSFDNNI